VICTTRVQPIDATRDGRNHLDELSANRGLKMTEAEEAQERVGRYSAKWATGIGKR
jgi:hypothetical protein